MNKNTSSPYLHNGSYWPSAYDRDVWYFNVSLAKEAVTEFGFYVEIDEMYEGLVNVSSIGKKCKYIPEIFSLLNKDTGKRDVWIVKDSKNIEESKSKLETEIEQLNKEMINSVKKYGILALFLVGTILLLLSL